MNELTSYTTWSIFREYGVVEKNSQIKVAATVSQLCKQGLILGLGFKSTRNFRQNEFCPLYSELKRLKKNALMTKRANTGPLRYKNSV